jgi:dTDP-4-dehydrorhamnose 3,5-epimerase
MDWVKKPIDGVVMKKLVKHVDNRGFLTETFRLDEMPEGINPVMSYISYTEPGVSRGPHEHKEQTDIFAFVGPGNFLLRLWDRREGSSTYGCYMEFYAGQDNPLSVIIPPGVVHGYKNVSRLERGMVLNYPDRLFMGWGKKEAVDEIRYEDDPDSEYTME